MLITAKHLLAPAMVLSLALLAGQTPGIAADADNDKAAKAELKAKLKALRKMQQAAAKAAAAAKADEKPAVAEVKPAEKPAPKPVVLTAEVKAATAKLVSLIDRNIDEKLATAKVPPSPRANDAEYLRRVYLDLTGVIPTAERAAEFLDSKDPEKRAKLVEELLADTNYGRHQADIWQAMLIAKDSDARRVQRDPMIKWLEEKFNANTPWDKFVRDVVTAEGSQEDSPAVTFFLTNRTIDKLTDGVSRMFLGVQLQCAQCHNHPFVDYKQTEYWGMAQFFSKVQPANARAAAKNGNSPGVQEGRQPNRNRMFLPESAKVVNAKFLRGDEPKLKATEPYRPVLAEWLTKPENPYFARAMVNRTWAQFFGRGFVNPIDDMHPDNVPSHPELLAALTKEFAGGGFDLKHLIRGICNSNAYQRSSIPAAGNEKDVKLFSHVGIKVLTPEQMYDSMSAALGGAIGEGRGGNARPAAAAQRGQPNTPRDRFVSFFLAGNEAPNPAEYEAGIPQALKLMNGPFQNRAQAVATQISRTSATPGKAVEQIYLTALSRRPSAAESAKLLDYVRKADSPQAGLSDVLWAVLNSSEFTTCR